MGIEERPITRKGVVSVRKRARIDRTKWNATLGRVSARSRRKLKMREIEIKVEKEGKLSKIDKDGFGRRSKSKSRIEPCGDISKCDADESAVFGEENLAVGVVVSASNHIPSAKGGTKYGVGTARCNVFGIEEISRRLENN